MSANEKFVEAAARCTGLRDSFDSGFAAPAAQVTESLQDLLAVCVGGDAYALRLSEISGLQVDLTIVSVPSPAPHLLGLAGIRGTLTPIYDLAGLLGYPQAPSARWVILVRATLPVGLALERFEAHLRVPADVLDEAPHNDGLPARRHARGAVQAAGALRPILQLAPLVELIRERTHVG